MEEYLKILVTYYKGLCSLTAWGKADVSYSIGEWSSAPGWLLKRGYGLMVFQDIACVHEFLRHEFLRYEPPLSPPPLYRVAIEGLLPPPLPPRQLLYALSCGQFQDDLKDTTFPKGTLMCRRVKLLREVDWYTGV